jgi:chromosome segregation ATPase
MPKANTQDPMQDRIDKIMDKFVPMILTFKMLGQLMTEDTPRQKSQQDSNQKAELPPEYKEQMAAIQAQLAATQALLEQQSQERKRKEEHDELVNTMQASFNPQIDALRNQVEALTASLAAKELETKTQPQVSNEYREIATQLQQAVDKLGQKEAASKLNLDGMNTFLGTLETLEKRLKKEPTGDFDWKAATVSTLGEIGKEAVSVFREVQASRPQQYQNQMQPAAAAPQQDRYKVAKRQVQGYIMKLIDEGATQLNMIEAAKQLGLTAQEVNQVYSDLVAEGWIKQPAAQAAQQAPQMQPAPQQQPQTQIQPPTQPQPQGGTTPDAAGTTNQPFQER